jgi:hypothetical protein
MGLRTSGDVAEGSITALFTGCARELRSDRQGPTSGRLLAVTRTCPTGGHGKVPKRGHDIIGAITRSDGLNNHSVARSGTYRMLAAARIRVVSDARFGVRDPLAVVRDRHSEDALEVEEPRDIERPTRTSRRDRPGRPGSFV